MDSSSPAVEPAAVDLVRRAYEVLLERVPNTSLMVFDRELRFVLAGGAHLFRQAGVAPSSLVGRLATDTVSPENREQVLPLYRAALDGNESRATIQLRDRTYDVQIVPARDERRAIVGGIVVSHDVTDLAAYEQMLQRRTAWLESVLEAMDDAVVVMDRNAHIVLANEIGRQLVGDWPNARTWPAGSGFFMADQKTPYPLDYLPGAQALRGTRVRQLELFLRSPGSPGNGVWQSINACPLKDPDGSVNGAVVVSRDTTILREASLEILKQNRHRGLLHEVAAAANQWTDVTQVLCDALAAIAETTGWPLGHAYLRRGNELVPTDFWVGTQLESYRTLIDLTMGTPVDRLSLVERATRDGRILIAQNLAAEARPPRDAAFQKAGLVAGVFLPIKVGQRTVATAEFFLSAGMPAPDNDFLSVLEDAASTIAIAFERAEARAALEHHSQELQALSIVDELTGLYNRRGFLTLAEQQRRAGLRTRLYHHLIFVDLDGMKAINDRFGHAEGDVALRDTAELLRSVFRESDILARLGGDEFVVFAASGTLDGDQPILARVREALRVHNATVPRPFKLEMSLGSTPCDPERPQPIEELLRIADERMYEQKRRRKSSAVYSQSE